MSRRAAVPAQEEIPGSDETMENAPSGVISFGASRDALRARRNPATMIACAV
jgi:hypothetical protein